MRHRPKFRYEHEDEFSKLSWPKRKALNEAVHVFLEDIVEVTYGRIPYPKRMGITFVDQARLGPAFAAVKDNSDIMLVGPMLVESRPSVQYGFFSHELAHLAERARDRIHGDKPGKDKVGRQAVAEGLAEHVSFRVCNDLGQEEYVTARMEELQIGDQLIVNDSLTALEKARAEQHSLPKWLLRENADLCLISKYTGLPNNQLPLNTAGVSIVGKVMEASAMDAYEALGMGSEAIVRLYDEKQA